MPEKCLIRMSILLPAEAMLKEYAQTSGRHKVTNCHVMARDRNYCFKQMNPLGHGNFPVSLLTYRHRIFSHPCHQLPPRTRAELQPCGLLCLGVAASGAQIQKWYFSTGWADSLALVCHFRKHYP